MKRLSRLGLRVLQEPFLLLLVLGSIQAVVLALSPLDWLPITTALTMTPQATLVVSSRLESWAYHHKGSTPRWLESYLISLNWWSKRKLLGMIYRYGYAVIACQERHGAKVTYSVRFVRDFSVVDMRLRYLRSNMGHRMVWDLDRSPRLDIDNYKVKGVPLEVKIRRTRRRAERDLVYLLLKGEES